MLLRYFCIIIGLTIHLNGLGADGQSNFNVWLMFRNEENSLQLVAGSSSIVVFKKRDVLHHTRELLLLKIARRKNWQDDNMRIKCEDGIAFLIVPSKHLQMSFIKRNGEFYNSMEFAKNLREGFSVQVLLEEYPDDSNDAPKVENSQQKNSCEIM